MMQNKSLLFIVAFVVVIVFSVLIIKWYKEGTAETEKTLKQSSERDFPSTAVVESSIYNIEEIKPKSTPSASSVKKNFNYWPTNGWRESTPEEQGMDSEKLLKLDETIQKERSDIHSVVVIRNGYKVFEKYYNSFGKDDVNNIKSCTKSVISVLTGIALKEKYLTNLDEKLADFFPEYFPKEIEKEKKDVTIKHILTMTTGFQANESWTWPLLQSNNWIKFTIDSKLITIPGSSFDYSSPVAHLQSGILTKAVKMSTLDFAKKYLFSPLGIKTVKWDKDPQGYYYGAGDMYLTPRDMAKIGYLYLCKGNWEGKQIVTSEWVQESTKIQVIDNVNNRLYGYMWWILKMNGYNVYFAAGYGGQFIFVIPDLDIITVVTSHWDEQMSGDFHFNIINNYVIPSIYNEKKI